MNIRVAALDPDFRPAIKSGVSQVWIDGEVIVYAPDADALHHLDKTGSAVWSFVDGQTTLRALSARLAIEFATNEARVLTDVLTLAESLWNRGLFDGSKALAEFTGRRPGQPDYIPADRTLVSAELPTASHRTRSHVALAHRFDVATNATHISAYLDYIFRDFTAGEPSPLAAYELLAVDGGNHVLACDGEIVIGSGSEDRAFSALLWHINVEAVRKTAPEALVLHAAGAVRAGATVLLPAQPESGKTTTVAGLVRAGFGYLSDEAVPIDPVTLLPTAYPKALSVDRGSWEVLADIRPQHADRIAGQWQVPATSIRPDAVADAAPVRFVVAPRYQPDVTTRLVPVSVAAMLVRLADSTFHFRDSPQRNLEVLARLVHGARCYELVLSDLDEAVRLVTNLVDSEQLDVAE